MAAKRARVRVSGAVQGVGYRVDTLRRAQSLGVAGWVRNLPDGAVEAVFEGNEDGVDSMVDWSRNGPAGAVVSDVDVDWEEPRGEAGFRVS